MDHVLATAGLIAVGALAPGPNNLVVLRLATLRGLAAAVPAICGIVLGGLAVLLLVYAGVESLLADLPVLKRALATAACGYIGWIGARMVVGGSAGASAPLGRLPLNLTGLFAFQLVQPGPWLLAVASLSSIGSTVPPGLTVIFLAASFVFIPTICLVSWSLVGQLVSQQLARRSLRGRREGLDRVLGTLLFGLAVAILLRVLETL